jgi:RNAse (barnase) inhibitor barstar
MSAFSNIPSHAVLPLGAYVLDDLKKACARADQRWLQVNFKDCHDKNSVLAAIAKAFALPKHFGQNLDALFDCLTDLKPVENVANPGFAIVLENLPDHKALPASDRNAILDVFRDAADFFFDQKIGFRVFYSVTKPG